MTDERAREGLEHLQAAALELIAAGRAFLDVVEELVKEPGVAAAMARAATAATANARRSRQGESAADEPGPGSPGVERIDLA